MGGLGVLLFGLITFVHYVGNVHVVIVNEDQAEKPALRVQTSDARPADAAR